MADAPVVRNLNDLVSTIGQGIKPQLAGIDQSIADNQKYGDAQIAGLDAKKTTAFGDITQAANDKGMFFSGFAPDQEAKYTADTYLPALAGLQQTIAQTRAGLFQDKNKLNTDVFNKAFDTQNQDVATLADWNKMTAQQQFDASESDKQRVFTAQQNQADRAAQQAAAATSAAASRYSADRSASASASNTPSSAQNMAAALSSKTGNDGYVSPGTYSSLKTQWTAGGYGDAKTFDATFAGYRNPKNNGYSVTK